jgi:tetratricopeptide (TPR) repeat protein
MLIVMRGKRFQAVVFVFLALAVKAVTPAEEAYTRAAAALQANDFATARKELETCIRLEPGRPEFRYAYAVVLTQLGEWSPALSAVEECLRLKPGFPKAEALLVSILNSRGLDAAAQGRFPEATADFRAITRKQPKFAAAHYNLGLALLNLGQPAEAERSFQQTLKIAPNHAKALARIADALLAQGRAGNKDKMTEAANAYRAAIRMDSTDPDLHYNLAFVLGQLGDDSGAKVEYEQVLRLKPDFPSAEFSLGFTLFSLSEYHAAEAHLRRATEQNVKDFRAQYYLGTVLVKTGDKTAALQYLKNAAKLDPEQPGVHYQLASVYRAAGDRKAAIEEQQVFRELSARQEQKRRANALQAAAGLALERGELSLGITAMTNAYQEQPTSLLARNLALAHLQQNRFEEARTWLQRALEIAPEDAVVYNYLGLLEARKGNLQRAYDHFVAATKLDPKFSEAFYNAGVAAMELERNAQAVPFFETVVARDDSVRAREALALALFSVGRDEDAQKQIEAAQKLR